MRPGKSRDPVNWGTVNQGTVNQGFIVPYDLIDLLFSSFYIILYM